MLQPDRTWLSTERRCAVHNLFWSSGPSHANLHYRSRALPRLNLCRLLSLPADPEGRIFILITERTYPVRAAHACLEEFQRTVRLSPLTSGAHGARA
jgi:hypothetical protein